MELLNDKDLRDKLTYSILNRFAKKKDWIEYHYDDGFYMFGPNDDETRKGVEEKHLEWLNKRTVANS